MELCTEFIDSSTNVRTQVMVHLPQAEEESDGNADKSDDFGGHDVIQEYVSLSPMPPAFR